MGGSQPPFLVYATVVCFVVSFVRCGFLYASVFFVEACNALVEALNVY